MIDVTAFTNFLDSMPKDEPHYEYLGKFNRHARNEHIVKPLSPWFKQLTDRELINLMDGGPFNFGGHVDKNYNTEDGTWSISVYID